MNCSFQFGAYLYKNRCFSTKKMLRLLWNYGRFYNGMLSVVDLHEKVFKQLFIGRPKQEFVALSSDFCEKTVAEILYDPAVARLRKAQERGETVAICSNSPDFLVEWYAAYFGVDRFCGTTYQVNERGEFTGVEVLDKVRFLKQFKMPSVAYSDSINDLAFLSAAGKAVGVKPDRALQKVCLQNHWEVI